MAFCPLTTTEQWKNHVEAVGETKAYYLYHINNGNPIDLTPDGNPSSVYDFLLSKYNDPVTAIREKAKFYSSEFLRSTGNWIKEGRSEPFDPNEDVDYSIGGDSSQFKWNPEQQDTINKAEKFLLSGDPNIPFVIEGKAGTGKTTIVKAILKNQKGKSILVGALSNVAKDVIRESMESEIPGASYKSIAGMLGMKLDQETGMFEEDRYADKPIGYADIIVIDEASMVNEEALELIMKHKRPRAKVIFLGDIGQLAPIRTIQNNFYKQNRQYLEKKSPVFSIPIPESNRSKLVTRVRQGEGSVILPFADFFWNNSQSETPVNSPAKSSVRANSITPTGALLFANDMNMVVDQAIDVFSVAVATKNPKLLKIVTYRNQVKESINNQIHNSIFGIGSPEFNSGELIIFNAPYGEIDNGTQSYVDSFYERDVTFDGKSFKVLELRIPITKEVRGKSETVFEEVPVIARADKKRYEDYVSGLFKNAFAIKHIDSFNYRRLLKEAWDAKNAYANLDYSYAITSHKSQGSTYDMVIVNEKDIMGVSATSTKNKSESIYTAITRAKNAVIMISSEPVENYEITDLVTLNENINKTKKESSEKKNNEQIEEVKKVPPKQTVWNPELAPWNTEEQEIIEDTEEVIEDDAQEELPIQFGEPVEPGRQEENIPDVTPSETPSTPSQPLTLKGKMTFDYSGNQREGLKGLSTIDAVALGERTATTRYESDKNIDYWKQAKVGDLIEFEGKNGKKVIVRVTKALHKLKGSGKSVEQWSELEGWSVEYFNKKVFPKLDEAWHIEYELVSSNFEVVEQKTISEPVQQPTPIIESPLLNYNDRMLRDFLSKHVIDGLSSIQQYKLTLSLSTQFIDAVLNGNFTGKQFFDAFFNDYLDQVTAQVSNDEKHVGILRTVKNNRDIVQRQVLNYVAKISDSRIDFDEMQDDIEMEDSMNQLERTTFSDNYSISINHKNTATGKLKRFLTTIPNVRNGQTEYNIFGLEEILPFDFVYNNVQATLANTPSSFNMMIDKLREESKAKPFLGKVAEKLMNADDEIKNAFVKNMTKHGIQMKFLMWKFDPKAGGYVFSVYDSNSSAIQQVLMSEWKSNMYNRPFTEVSPVEGETFMDTYELGKIVSRFEGWSQIASGVKVLSQPWKDIENYTPAITKPLSEGIVPDIKIKVKPESKIKPGQTVVTRFGTINYRMTRIEDKQNGDYFSVVEETEEMKRLPSPQELGDWLKSVGIVLSDYTLKDLKDGSVYFDIAGGKVLYSKLFSKGGPLRKFVDSHLKPRMKLRKSIEEEHPFDDTIVKNLAKHDSKYSLNKFSSSHRVAGKSIATATNNNFLMNRTMDLKSMRQSTIAQTMSNPFGKHNYILESVFEKKDGVYVMRNEQAFNGMNVFYASLEVMKKFGAKPRDNREMHKLSPLEQEIARINFFMANQNIVSINGRDSRKTIMVTPTMSDKTRVMLMEYYAPVFKINSEGRISDETAEFLFDHLIMPELERMKADEIGESPDLKVYEPNRFYVLPILNSAQNIFLDGKYNPEILIEGSELRNLVISLIKDQVEHETIKKENQWNRLGLVGKTKKLKGADVKLNLMNSRYMKTVAGSNVKAAAADYVINSYLFNTSFFQTFTGDPALYQKKKGDSIETVYENMGKRLAQLIAPGSELANSYNPSNKFRFAILEDHEVPSDYADYYAELGFDYSNITSTDAQEYVTWKEHLNSLWFEGRLSQDEYTQAYRMIRNGEDLPDKLLRTVIKPYKPVYVGSIYENASERRFYVKSSSIPLLPQLTRNFEIDKLRLAMESPGGADRVAYASAVKVGQGKKIDSIVTPDGRFRPNYKFESVVELPRSGFRIQQDIPDKEKVSVNDGSQQRTMLFLNFDDINTFRIGDRTGVLGRDLRQQYNEAYKKLYKNAMDSFIDEVSVNGNLDVTKVRSVILKEALTRGFSVNAIESLSLIDDGRGGKTFAIPLWLSPHSDKIEALLNSIVKNRITKQKMPGMSLILSSDTGFKLKSFNKKDTSTGVILTDRFDGNTGLKPMRPDGQGGMLPAQVFVPERIFFKGRRVDLTKYMDSETGLIDTSKMDPALFELFGFRIPTQGHNSMAYIEVVGFIKGLSDTIIAPKEFVKQMGSDFDVDKLYAYMPVTFSHKGQNYKLSPSTKQQFKEAKLDNFKSKIRKSIQKLKGSKEFIMEDSGSSKETLKEFMNDLLYSDTFSDASDTISNLLKESGINSLYLEMLEEQLERLEGSEEYFDEFIEEALLKNEIFDIHIAVMSNADKRVQRQISQPLEYGLLQKADNTGLDVVISSLKDKRNKAETSYFTAVSDSYQSSKFLGGTAGKAGTSVFSLSSVFNAAIQSSVPSEQITMMKPEKNQDNKTVMVPYTLTLFGKASDGNLSGINLLNQNRPKSEAFAAYQSASVDNENQRIIEKINVNEVTFGVINVMTQLGFDEESVIYFINQPIIEDYVELYKSVSGGFDGFTEDVEAEVIKQLNKKYPSENPADVSSISMNEASDMISGENIDATFNDKQKSFLNLFSEMKVYGSQMQQHMTTVNSDSKGVPVTMTDVLDKSEKIKNLGYDPYFDGIGRILGQYSSTDTGIQINPTTVKGFASVYGVMTALDTFGTLFPFSSKEFDRVVQQFNAFLNIKPEDYQYKTNRELVHNELKSFFLSYSLPVYRNTAYNVRENLLVDSKSNQSLSSFMDNHKGTPYFQTHPLISKFSYDFSNRGKGYSYVEYDAASNEDLDERMTHISWIEMFRDDTTVIGKRNGQNVTPKRLAEDLVAYSLLTGGSQGAKNFLKYLPIPYLMTTGTDNALREIPFEGMIYIDPVNMNQPSDVVRQILQNNPSLVYELPQDALTKNTAEAESDLKSGGTVLIKKKFAEDNALPPFITFRGENDKLYLFEKVGIRYERLPLLGERKASEYYPDGYGIESTVPSNKLTGNETNATLMISGTQHYAQNYASFKPSPLSEALEKVNSNAYYSAIAKIVAGAMKKFPSVTVENVISLPITDPVIREVAIKKNGTDESKGSYNSYEKKVRLNLARTVNSIVDIEETLLHESFHAFTSAIIKTYTAGDPNGILTEREKGFALRMQELQQYVKDRISKAEIEASDRLWYGLEFNLEEFVTLASTNPEFQKHLNSIQYKNENATVMDKIKQFYHELLSGLSEILGIPVDSDSVLAVTVAEILDFASNDDLRIITYAKYKTDSSFLSDYSIPYDNIHEFKYIAETAENIFDEATEKIDKLCQ